MREQYTQGLVTTPLQQWYAEVEQTRLFFRFIIS